MYNDVNLSCINNKKIKQKKLTKVLSVWVIKKPIIIIFPLSAAS